LVFDRPLPGRVRFIAHAVREIRNRLPDTISGRVSGNRLEYTQWLDRVSEAWQQAGFRAGGVWQISNPGPPVVEDLPANVTIPVGLFDLISDLIAEHHGVKETRAEAAARLFEACAPENRPLMATLRPVVKNWMDVTDWFMARAHDSGATDSDCDEGELRGQFELFEATLGSLVRAFFASLDDLDKILDGADVGQVDRAVSLLGRAEHCRYFFDRLDDPRWVGPLARKGFFRQPPPLVPVEGGESVRIPRWPESVFLARVAGRATDAEKEQIAEIALQVPDTENVSVQQDLADVVLALPPALAVEFVPRAKKWIESRFPSLVPTKVGELVIHLACGGYSKKAIELARALLTVLPDARASDQDSRSEGYRRPPEPRARFPTWSYGEILRRCMPELVQRAGQPAFAMLCALLNAAVRRALPGSEDDNGRDYSSAWRRAIEEHEQNGPSRSLRELLAEAVRDAALQLVQADPAALRRIVEQLERHKYAIFGRIALHLLRVHSDADHQLIAERLTAKALFDSTEHHHEYTLLLRDRFSRLTPDEQGLILAWIEGGPDLDGYTASFASWTGHRPSMEDVERYADRYRLEHLASIRDALPDDWRRRFDALRDRLGEPGHPDFLHYKTFGRSSDDSPKTADELRAMSVEEIIEFLRTWQPASDPRGPSRDGLGQILSALVRQEPGKFVPAAGSFRDLDPAYAQALISGLRDAVREDRDFPWPPVLNLCGRVAYRGIADAAAGQALGHRSPGQVDLEGAVADLLQEALDGDRAPIPSEQRGAVWDVLSALVNAPVPQPAGDSSDLGPGEIAAAPFSAATRVRVLRAVISYGLWVLRQSRGIRGSEGPLEGILSEVPEVAKVLDTHLDPTVDSSLAVHAFYGQEIPLLAALDEGWITARLPRLFPKGGEVERFCDAAWRGFVIWNHPSQQVFRLLREEYGRAIDRIGSSVARGRPDDPDWRLTRHLMVLCWHGELDPDDPGGLLARFFTKAPGPLQAEALEYLGMILQEEASVPGEVLDRLRRLWATRLEAARTATDRAAHSKEVSAFGGWFASGRFDNAWSMAQLIAVLKLVGKAEPEHVVVERLAWISSEMPMQAVECLELLAEGYEWDYHVYAWTERARTLLGNAIAGPLLEARQAAVGLVNLLGAHGHHQFRDLLPGPGLLEL
jgi:hypothetical protein